MINYGKHFINKDDISSVIRVLKSKFLTQGQQVPIFEKKNKLFLWKQVFCCGI